MTRATTDTAPDGGTGRGRDTITVSGAVSAALAAGRPVVALESTIFSRLGLPAPANGDALASHPVVTVCARRSATPARTPW